MKICHLTSVHRAFDNRIFHKEAKSLAKKNHDVSIIAQHVREETEGGVRIIPLPCAKNRLDRMTRIVFALIRKALREKPDVYHFHDPELVPAGLFLKLFTRAAVFYDVHEDYPKLILDKEWIESSLARKIISRAFNALEKTAALFFDAIITVTDDIVAKFPAKKTVLLRNFVLLEMIDNVVPKKNDTGKTVIINMGSLERNRGIREIVQSMEILDGRAELWLLGKWAADDVQRECENTPGWQHTKYFGFMKPDEAFSYLKAADIGLHCVYPNDFYLIGLPTKLFEYAACRKPTLITYSKYWDDQFGEFVVFTDPLDPADIASKISNLIDDEELRTGIGDRARAFVEKKYTWEAESEKLVEAYECAIKKR